MQICELFIRWQRETHQMKILLALEEKSVVLTLILQGYVIVQEFLCSAEMCVFIFSATK